MELRTLTPEDRADVAALFSDVFTHEPWNDDWHDAIQLSAYLADLAYHSNSLSLGYFDGRSLAALALGHIKHWHAGTEYVIEEFCVAKPLQGKGIGSAFMQAIEAYLLRIGIRHIFLQTERDVPAYAFYLRLGFTDLKDHASLAKTIDEPYCRE